MHVLHGTWIPNSTKDFYQLGVFYVWVETPAARERRRATDKNRDLHPHHLQGNKLIGFFAESRISSEPFTSFEGFVANRYLWLPTADGRPLPSLELAGCLEEEVPETAELKCWRVECLELWHPLRFLNDFHFLTFLRDDVRMGADLLFWYRYGRSLRNVFLKDRFVPALRCRESDSNSQSKSKTKSKAKAKSTKQARSKSSAGFGRSQPPRLEFYPAWDILSDRYETDLERFAAAMPPAARAAADAPAKTPCLWEAIALLRHFSESCLHELISTTLLPAVFLRKLNGTLISHCVIRSYERGPGPLDIPEQLYRQWLQWRHRLADMGEGTPFALGFQLIEAEQEDDRWYVNFLVADKVDPSWKLDLEAYWDCDESEREGLRSRLGEDFEKYLLMHLGCAARICPAIWRGLETDEPVGLWLTLQEAFDFLKESALVLEDAGFKVILPAWWTPTGRQRIKMRLRARAGEGKSLDSVSTGHFSLDRLMEYDYQLAIGDRDVSPQEWQELMQSKAPLVQMRGQWVELDRRRMEQILELWNKQGDAKPDMTLLDLMRKSADEEDLIEVEPDEALGRMLERLRDSSCLQPADNPARLQGKLREYQKRGLAWLQYLEQLGLNGCLADDMGLGKSIQVIARLLSERETEVRVPPTLLIVPTSVVGNWQREVEKFAPDLKVSIHHGSDRPQEAEAFREAIGGCDAIVTSYALARRDVKVLSSVTWQRLVLDEAQNIKNPKAAQTKAILSLQANYRLALTGTPVENRLMDLWSLFNFLNPGYLGKQAAFRKNFETPIQRDNDRQKSLVLKKLVEPFVLRRLKTDASIIKDLPEKMEQKEYCNLTEEQASLYEAVVKNAAGLLQDAEQEIQRKGIVLATLTKLKQVCNHPAQFLQDGSDFSAARSHKLSRLLEMLEESLAEGDSALVFTQFAEVGSALERCLRREKGCKTFYLYGGTSRKKREQAIAEFQDPETEPSVFVLSLKAGGVGITLTKASRVFHFDRWWNPAVEDQATDRAFRIGQKKNVFVHKFIAIGTVEERIDKAIEEKKSLASAIVGADESWLTELSDENFKELIALNRQVALA